MHEGYRTEARHLLKFGTRLERSVLLAIFDDVLGCSSVESADVHQQVAACGIEVNAYGVHARFYNHIQALLQFVLVDIVLILTYTNALGVYLYKFGKRVHESATD